jgi:tellurite resistance protein TehA-like permease
VSAHAPSPEQIPPGSGAVVMGTGIVSVAVSLQGALTLSRILLGLAAATWLGLAGMAGYRLVAAPRLFLDQARTPAALTGVAASAVLGSRVLELGWPGLAIALLIVASAAWLVLMPLVLSALPRKTTGEIFMVTVATEAISVLSAQLAVGQRATWLVTPALVFAALGIAFYPFVLARFRLAELRWGAGDQWVSGGSLAITALALSNIVLASRLFDVLTGATLALQDAALAVWAAAALWLVPLLLSELRWPRLHYAGRRWGTVFPLGMYAVCSSAVAIAAGVPTIAHLGTAWGWVALAGWAWVGSGVLARGAMIARNMANVPVSRRPRREELK